MARIYQPRTNGIWYLDYQSEDGTRIRRSSGTTDEAEARRILREEIGEAEPITDFRVKSERKIIELQDEVVALRKRLRIAHRDSSLFEACARVIREETPAYQPVELVPRQRKEGQTPVDFVVALSDEHADQVITTPSTWGFESYNFDVFRIRAERYVEEVRGFASEYQPKYFAERCWVMKGGDALHGDIHRGADRNYFQNTLKAALAVGDVEAEMIRAWIPYFPGGVHVVCVSGNHTRRGPKKDFVDPHDNFDYLVAERIRTRLAPEIEAGKCSVFIPHSYSAFVDIRGHLFFLSHGDGVKGFAGHPWYGFDRLHNRVQALIGGQVGQNRQIEFFVHGHFHTAIQKQNNGRGRSLHMGNWSYCDHFSTEGPGVGSEPIQQIWMIGDKRGLLGTYEIEVRDEEKERAFFEGRYLPVLGRGAVENFARPEVTFAERRLSVISL